MKKVLLTATVQSHICQFHKPLVEILHEKRVEVHVAARDNLAEKNGLKLDFVDEVFDVPFHRSPFSSKNLKAYKILKKIIDDGDYDVIHCNTPVAGILTRMAAKKARKHGTKVFYTAHGFHFYKGAPLKSWLIWYPIEKHFAKKCDTLITITEEDYRLAKQKFKTNVEHMHGVGVDENRYHSVNEEENLKMRQTESLSENDFVILCTGELNENKNQMTLISVAALLKDKIFNVKVLLAGNGPKDQELKQQVQDLGVADIVRFLGYRTDLENVVPCVDLVVSCSKREGLPLNIIEAMLCQKPIVASHNRGHDELVIESKNGYLLKYDDVSGFAEKIFSIYSNKDEILQFGDFGYNKAQGYIFPAIKNELKKIYGC